MKNIKSEERDLKRYLKNHISLNTESMVKFLITGVVAFSLTACGGGGGGGSSESAPIPPVVEPEKPPVVEEVVLPEENETVTLNGQNVNLTGSMAIDKNNSKAVGVMATNSTVISKASITIEGSESVALYGTVDKTTLNSKATYTITNDGDIKISGKNSVGMLVENGVLGVNKGQIRLEETDTIGMVAQNGSIVQNDGVITGFGTGMLAKGASEAQNNGSIELESLRYEGDKIVDEYLTQNERLSKVTGLKATGENSVAINNKDIKVSGYGVGIEVDEKAKGLNSGYIEMSSEAVDSTYNWGENIKGVSYSEIVGMEAKSAEIENGENGKIYLHGRAIGMKATENSIAQNNGEIILEAKYETSDFTFNDGIEDEDYMWSSIAGMFADNSTIENNGKIIHLNDGQGMKAQNNSKAINNGDIVLTSVISNENGDYVSWDYHVIGMELKDSVGENNGNIVITGNAEHKAVTIENSDFINNGSIEVESVGEFAIGISIYENAENKTVVNKGDIKVFSGVGESTYSDAGHATGVSMNEGIFINEGSIVVETEGGYARGISSYTQEEGGKVEITNKGTIEVYGENSIGIVSEVGLNSFNAPTIKNDGKIIVVGKTGDDIYSSEIVTGIRAFNYGEGKGIVINNGSIEVESSDDARGIDSFGNDVINNGTISVKGNGTDANGIRVQGDNGIYTAVNNGTINVDGEGAWGMYAGGGGVAINSTTGIINVSATAEGAMFATNGGIVENYGTINTEGSLVLGSTTGGNYVIGTNEDGSYGKISAKNVDIDGDVIVSANITKNGFKDEYTMQNVIDAEDITLGDEFKLVSNSLLYDAKEVTDRWGNLDATLSRNDKVLSDFTTGYLNYSAEIFGKYQNEESFKVLSSDAKEVIKAIDTTSIESIGKSLNSLRATIYSNLGRQMLETTETFRSQDLVAIDNLEGNTYNFTFIGEYRDVDSRKGIDGYESKMTGFVGAMNFGDGTYGTIGYGHNKVDYTDNGDGKIETIHLGLNRFMNYSGLDLRVGLGGEYNFHENKRDIDILSRKAESDFDSYGVNASAEISKKFGDDIYLKPSLGLDLAYMKYDSFSEEKAKSANANVESESYTSVTPKVGALLGGTFGGLDIYTSAQYSYELGDMEKDIQFSYEGFDGMDRLVGDDLECGTTSLKAGVNYKMNSLTVGGTIGKNFGRRDNSFVSLNLGYRF